MNQTEHILTELRDIQLPPAPEGVPVWLIAANLLLLLLILLGLYRRWYRQREHWRRDALTHIAQARHMAPASAMLELAKLLRQILLYRQHDISTTGHLWQLELDAAFNTHWFTQEEGRAFGEALYRQSDITDEELQCLCDHLEQLIKKLPVKTKADSKQQHTT